MGRLRRRALSGLPPRLSVSRGQQARLRQRPPAASRGGTRRSDSDTLSPAKLGTARRARRPQRAARSLRAGLTSFWRSYFHSPRREEKGRSGAQKQEAPRSDALK